jgi:hypothetical protein
MSEIALFKGGVPAYLRQLEDDTTNALAAPLKNGLWV